MDAQKSVDVNASAAHTRADTRLRDTLRAAGLRVTRPRTLVYHQLCEMGGHRTVDDIVAGLAGSGTALPRMTVYNVVADLVSVGAMMRADAGPGSARYEVSDTWHHHFVCRQCGVIMDVPCAVDARPCLNPVLPEGVTVDEAQVIFRGLCGNCGG